ncbi:MAG: hypothetical protein R3F31_01440 [Verrucomicrobiales bacterium]
MRIDLHANRAETDLMLHLAPRTVDMSVVERRSRPNGRNRFSHPVSRPVSTGDRASQ